VSGRIINDQNPKKLPNVVSCLYAYFAARVFGETHQTLHQSPSQSKSQSLSQSPSIGNDRFSALPTGRDESVNIQLIDAICFESFSTERTGC
jgi:hypothetical protein